MTFPYVETVGSFLLPESLKDARVRFDNGQITADELRQAENAEIEKILDRQKEEGLTIVSDGEFRRRFWDKSFFAQINGIELVRFDEGRVYQPTKTFTDLVRLVEPISFNPDHSVFAEFAFLKQEAEKRGLTPRIAIPAPAQLYYELMKYRDTVLAIYGNVDALIVDIAKVYREILRRLYELGARHIQFDDTVWHRLCDPARARRLLQDGRNILTVTANDLRVNNLSLEGRPDGLYITEHLCQCDHDSDIESHTNFVSVADTVLAHLDVDAFHIPVSLTDSDDTDVLAKVPAGKRVILGVVSPVTPMIESAEQIAETISRASQYIDPSLLAIAPRCGFNWPENPTIPLVETDQWNKIRLLRQIAQN